MDRARFEGTATTQRGAKTALENLTLYLTALRPRSERTVYLNRRYSERFLASIQELPPVAPDVLRFLSTFPAQNTKALVWHCLQNLYTGNGWLWPFPARSGPRTERRDQPILRSPDVRSLVQHVLHGEIDSEGAAYVALSTIYGFRRAELGLITRSVVQEGEIVLQPVKHGILRHHSIPESIIPYLKGLPLTPQSPGQVSAIWYDILYQINKDIPGSFHAIRRGVTSGLEENGVPALLIVAFMGWKSVTAALPGIPNTLGFYGHPSHEVVDREVFLKHPFLPFWSDND